LVGLIARKPLGLGERPFGRVERAGVVNGKQGDKFGHRRSPHDVPKPNPNRGRAVIKPARGGGRAGPVRKVNGSRPQKFDDCIFDKPVTEGDARTLL
jgi:hypothetical protein